MYFNNLANTILNTRPLVFLCGPYIDENDKKDRRNILRRFLNEIKENVEIENSLYEIEPFALIVDKLFDNTELSEKMNITLIEEVIAACAFKNYIFIDTMSTVLELGLFSNSFTQNKTTALLPNDYELFKPSIGYFVTETLYKSQNITLCKYKNRRFNKITDNGKRIFENLVGFKSNIIPQEIKKEILTDFSENLSKYTMSMQFTRNVADSEKIFFDVQNNVLEICIPAKNLFYLVNKYLSMVMIYKVILEYFKQNVCSNMPEYMIIYYLVVTNKMGMVLRSSFKNNFNEVFENMLYLIKAIKDKTPYPQKFKNLQYTEIDKFRYNKKISFFELLGFVEHEMFHMKIKFKSKSKAVTKKRLVINGKQRTIIMYKGTSEGYELRNINKRIVNNTIKIIELNDNSYAYQKGKSAYTCVKKHINGRYFLKLDIINFFNSISKRKMNKIIKMLLSNNGEENYILNLKGDMCNYNSSIIDSWQGVETLLNLCFVNGRLSLGLSSSPTLSNIYMNFFDKRFCNTFPNLTYTRYSDDILISSEKEFKVNEVMDYILADLNLLNLKVNISKTRFLKLMEVGDHIKFLGLNIIKGKENNYISVGKKYIKFVSKNVTNFLRRDCKLKKSQIIGQIEYLKFVSENDYNEFIKIFKIKTGNDFNYDKFRIMRISL